LVFVNTQTVFLFILPRFDRIIYLIIQNSSKRIDEILDSLYNNHIVLHLGSASPLRMGKGMKQMMFKKI